MRDTRLHLIQTAAGLFQRQGVGATGLSEIIKVSGTPKGSLYYYFPEGKDQLVAAAIDYAGSQILAEVQTALAKNSQAEDALMQVCQDISAIIKKSGHLENVSISLIALETIDKPKLQQACAHVFDQLAQAYAQKIAEAGVSADTAAQLGIQVQALIEGAATIAATKRQPDLLLGTGATLQKLVAQALAV